MAWLKKVDPEWHPSENRNLQVGELIQLGAYEKLVRDGTAVMVDKDGNEIELPGQELICPICFTKFIGIQTFMEHVGIHAKKKNVELIEKIEEVKEEIKEEKKEEVRPLYPPRLVKEEMVKEEVIETKKKI